MRVCFGVDNEWKLGCESFSTTKVVPDPGGGGGGGRGGGGAPHQWGRQAGRSEGMAG